MLKDSVAKGKSIMTLQMELNYGLDPRAAEHREVVLGEGGFEKVNACASFQHSSTPEPGNFGSLAEL